MTCEFLKTGVKERVAWIEYQRPPLNAIDWKMLGEIPIAPASPRGLPVFSRNGRRMGGAGPGGG